MALPPNTDKNWSNIHHAVVGKFTNLIQSLLEQESNKHKREQLVNGQDIEGATPLHLACMGIVFDLAVDELDAKDRRISSDSEQIVELLLSHGANPRVLDNSGKSPVHYLVSEWLEKQYSLGELRKIIAKFVQSGGNSVNVSDCRGRTLLHYVAGSPGIEVQVALKVVEGIIVFESSDSGSDSDKSEAKVRYTSAQQLFFKEFCVELIKSGANINLVDNEGNTPLHFAITAGKFDVAKQLLTAGNCDINAANINGQTPLHLSVVKEESFKKCAILLLHKGALASIRDAHGNTAIDVCRGRDNFQCFLKHLVLMISVKIHPETSIHMCHQYSRFLGDKMFNKACKSECENLHSYFNLNGTSQLSVFFQNKDLPSYTENEFFQTKVNSVDFSEGMFPIYSQFIKYKFNQDKQRKQLIEKCLCVFSCFGGSFYYTSTGRLEYRKHYHWEFLPIELKLKIISNLSNDELEFLHKQLGND